ncbi:MAG: N-acetylneuraminate synthase [Chthoniobacterales bacterium]|nr:N-acetylneuraminate synthase [Chthoniobacterales bacterium]
MGAGQPCFVIAEAGVNHNGDIALAHRLVEEAARAGANAVKFQTFKTERLVTRNAPTAAYQKRATAGVESQFELLKRLELTREMHRELIADCVSRDLIFLSSPFEEESADELIELEVKALKIPSGELTNWPFLHHVARKQIPVIFSTGMSSMEEVERAVEIFRSAGNEQLVLLHCVSNYPANPAECNLRAMQTLERRFNVPVGFSDHTEGIEIAAAAVALGACVIEKHFTLDCSLSGPDHQASLEPDELAAMIRRIRLVESALGNGEKIPAASERDTAEVARKSVVAALDIPSDTIIIAEMLTMKRPGTGLAAEMLPQLIGRRSLQPIAGGTLIAREMLS